MDGHTGPNEEALKNLDDAKQGLLMKEAIIKHLD